MDSFLLNIFQNISALLSLTLLVVFVRRETAKRFQLGPLSLGVLFGLASIYTMLTAFHYGPGIIFDTRTVVVELAGLLFGPVTGAVGMAFAAAYRILYGGVGAVPGTAMILIAGLGGILCHLWIKRNNWPPKVWQILVAACVVHIAVWFCIFILPPPLDHTLAIKTAIPYLVIFPLILTFVGMLITAEERRSITFSKLALSDTLFHEAQKNTRFGSWEYSLARKSFKVTEFFYELYSFSPDSYLRFEDILRHIHAEDRNNFSAAFTRLCKTFEPMDVEGRMLTPDDREIWVRMVGSTQETSGKVKYIGGNLIDISWRKTKELEIRANQKRLQAILDNTHALICICDLTAKVTLVNKRFNVFGGAYKEMEGKPLYEFLPRVNALEQWIDDLNVLIDGGEIEVKEKLEHADGTEHTYLTSKFLLSSYGVAPDSVCYISTDVTELEAIIVQKEAISRSLNEKNTELERFSYSISHDIKGPLLTISSFSQILYNSMQDNMTEEAEEAAAYIRSSVASIRTLIDGVLELSRVGRTIGDFAPVDLGETVEMALLSLEGNRQATGTEVEVAENLPVISGDALRLGQVFQNILQNAFKHAGNEMHIRIDWRKDDDSVIVSIADNGRGIAAEKLKKIFIPFEKFESSGSGIGLALVREIMEAHGGAVWAESPGVDQGTTFFLAFPVSKQADLAAVSEDNEDQSD